MKSATNSISALALLILMFGFAQCSKIDVEQPAPTDPAAIVLPVFRVAIDSNGNGSISLDTLIQKYPDFSLRFDPMVNGKFIVDVVKREARFERNNNKWTKDSTIYELCVNGTCKSSRVIVRNYVVPIIPVEPPPDTCETVGAFGPILVPLAGQTPVQVSPRLSWGKVTEVRKGIYNATVFTGDSTKIQFRAVGNSTFYGYDEVGYTIVDSLGKCQRGIIKFIIGDDCSLEAVNDVVTVSSILTQWNVSQFLGNESSPCSIPLDGFQFRIKTSDLNYNSTQIATANGIATDTLINGNQFLTYRKTNLLATKDSLWYYLYDKDNSLRISRARIIINF